MATELVKQQVADLPIPIARMVGRLPEDVIRTAVSQGPWHDALKDGGVAALAQGLALCAELGLSPVGKQVYVAKFGSSWQAFPSAYGMLAVANRRNDFDGATVLDSAVADGVATVTVEAYKKERRFPATATGSIEVARYVKVFGKRAEEKALSAAKTQALRKALTELYEGVLPPLTAEQEAYIDAIEVEEVDDAAPPAEVQAAGDATNTSPQPEATSSTKDESSVPAAASASDEAGEDW